MQVFKLCLKILRRNIPALAVYVIVFIGVAIIMTFAFVNERANDHVFTRSKSNIAFLSEENTPLIAGLKAELEKIANFIELRMKRKPCRTPSFSAPYPISCVFPKVSVKSLCKASRYTWKGFLSRAITAASTWI